MSVLIGTKQYDFTATFNSHRTQDRTRTSQNSKLHIYNQPYETVTVHFGSTCCKDLIGLQLKCNNNSNIKITKQLENETVIRKTSIYLASLCLPLSSTTELKIGENDIEKFDDDCDCISKVLEINDKLVFLALPSSLGEFVIPLIHNHVCIEHIYVYNDDDNVEWTKDYGKIYVIESNPDVIIEKMIDDMTSLRKRPSRWSRSKSLLSQLCLQSNEFSYENILIGDTQIQMHPLSNIRIVVLFHECKPSFQLTCDNVRINSYTDFPECENSFRDDPSSTVFLIICVGATSSIPKFITETYVHAVYIVFTDESVGPLESFLTYPKLSGTFYPDKDLLSQLTTDICFYRHSQIYSSAMSVFEAKSNILEKLDDGQTKFLCFQLFSTILQQIPFSSPKILTEEENNRNSLPSRLVAANMKITELFQKIDRSALERSVEDLQNINKSITNLAEEFDASSSDIVYRAQIVTQEDLELIKKSSNALFAIHTFVIASRSFQSVAEICLHAMDNQLNVILLQLKLTDKESITNLGAKTVVFNLGKLFRFVSIEPLSNGIPRVQLESVDGTMEQIADQLRFEIGGKLTWLTFGNYLTALKQYDAANCYYEYLLLVFPEDHLSRVSIKNNMGVVFSERNQSEKALESFNEALEAISDNFTTDVEEKFVPIRRLLPPESSNLDNATILRKIAEIHQHEGRKEEALDYYRQARDFAKDSATRQYLQAKIDEILYTVDKN